MNDLSHPNLARLSQTERLTLVNRIRIWYPRMKHLYDEIVRAYEMNPITPDPECLALLGQFRTGKTTIIESFYSQYPRQILPETTYVPVLKAVVPAKATVSSLLETLLSALGDPLAYRSTIGVKQHRLHQLVRDCGVRMIILDEASHFVDRDSQRVLHDVSNTMKNLIKEQNIACVLVGLLYTEEVLRVNEQFGSLFGDPRLLAPFRWEPAYPETIQEFRQFLRQFEQQLPLPTRTLLASKETAWRCFVATQGKVGYLTRLLRRSAEMAILQEAHSLTLEHLAVAFDQTLAGKRHGLRNPFTGEIPETAGPEEPEYWPVRQRRK